MEFIKKTSGYTLIEVIVAVGIFVSMITLTTSITINFYNAQKKERIRNVLIEETQYLANRIANLIRNNTISYDEYSSDNREQGIVGSRNNITYGNDQLSYEDNFYYYPTCEPGEKDGEDLNLDGVVCDHSDEDTFNEGYFNTNADNDRANDDETEAALHQITGATNTNGHEQFELYLVDSTGTKRTLLRRMSNGVDDDNDETVDEDGETFWETGTDGNIDGGERIGILEITAESDIDGDGILDFESEETNFRGDGNSTIETSDFIPISPRTIDIVDLRFFIAPLDDPRKAFAETGKDVQIQPHVTILLKTRPGKRFMRQLPGQPFEISMQTTITSRTLTNILFPES